MRRPQVTTTSGRAVARCGFACIFLCLQSLDYAAQVAPGARQPNIVIILADDLGYGDLRSYNADSRIPTPHLDRLAAAGMRFTDAHSPSGVCTPTRYGLLTGRYAWRTTLKRSVLNGYSPLLIEPGRMTVASLVKPRGYATAAIGKWHLGLGTAEPADFSQRLEPGPNRVGFDYFFGIPASLDMPPYVFVEDTAVTAAPTGTIASSEMRRRGGNGYWREGAIAPGFTHEGVLPTLTEKAVSFIGRQSPGKPFLLYLPLTAPHTPWMPTAEFRGKSGADYYGDFVVQVDATVGQVLGALVRANLGDNTLVIFTSDNGAHWLPTDIEQWRHRANGRWRGQKADIWEGGHRIPFIARWPGKVSAGTTRNDLVCLTDLFATVAAIVDVPVPPDAAEDSFNLLPALLGRTLQAPIREAIVHHANDGTFAIRQGPWKLALALGSRGFSDPREIVPKPGEAEGQLYNLEDDPGEQRNLWLQNPQIVARLTALLKKYQNEGRSR
jgi:arylsulfatase A-like enzyme